MSSKHIWALGAALLTSTCVAQTQTKQPEAANEVGMYIDLPPAPRNLHEYAVQEIQHSCKPPETAALVYSFRWSNKRPVIEQSVTIDCQGRIWLHNITLKEALRWIAAEQIRQRTETERRKP